MARRSPSRSARSLTLEGSSRHRPSTSQVPLMCAAQAFRRARYASGASSQHRLGSVDRSSSSSAVAVDRSVGEFTRKSEQKGAVCRAHGGVGREGFHGIPEGDSTGFRRIPGDSTGFRSHLAPEDARRVREFIGFGEMRRGIPPAELRPYIIRIRGFQQRAPSLPEASDQPQGGPPGPL